MPSPSPISPIQKQTLLWVAIVAVLGVLLWLLAPVLTPFLLAAILGYILNPGVDWMQKYRIPRWLGTTLMVLFLFALVVVLILIIVPVLQKEFIQARDKLPELLTRLQATATPKLREWFDVDIELSAQTVRDFITQHFAVESFATSALAYLRVGGAAALGWLTNAFLVPIVLFYLLIDWHHVWSRIERLIPRGLHARISGMTSDIDQVLAKFLRGQLMVMLILAVYYSVALSIAKFEVALPVGILTGLLVFIPYAGFAIGLTLALLAALLQFGSLYGFLAVAVIYGIGQVVESVFLTPRLVGESIGLHPLTVIFALLAFGELFGFFGILLALPVSAVLAVALKRAYARYIDSDFYRGRGHTAFRRTSALESAPPSPREPG